MCVFKADFTAHSDTQVKISLISAKEWGRSREEKKKQGAIEAKRKALHPWRSSCQLLAAMSFPFDGLLQCPDRPARLHEAERDERVFPNIGNSGLPGVVCQPERMKVRDEGDS